MSIICKLSVTAFKLPSYTGATETIWPAKSKKFTIWLFKENVYQTLGSFNNDLTTKSQQMEGKKDVLLYFR